MFYYISFLRPPPLQASPSGTLSITPQVANDLRTELFDDAQDIFFSWSQSSPESSKTELLASKPLKLTTWRPASAYKEIAVPLPQGVRDGQSWRLILTAQQADEHPHVIDLSGDAMGTIPFPVVSMPILFVGRGRESVREKQEQIQRVYRVPVSDGEVAYLTVHEQTSFDLDKKIWDSGLGLSSWLIDLKNGSPTMSSVELLTVLRESLFSRKDSRVLELGTGSGIVSLTLAILRSSLCPGNGCILATDLPSAMPLLEHNISINEHLFASARPQPTVLDWDEELPDSIHTSTRGFDVIIMADVTYNTSSFPALTRTLSALIRLQRNTKPPLLLLGYKERDPSERTLWGMAKDVGVVFEKVGERKGAGDASVEVWVGKVE